MNGLMNTDSPSDGTEVGALADDIEDVGPSNQMMTLASQIIAAMPERIKLSPSQSKQLLADEIQSRRNRAGSYGSSFSSYSSACSSNVTPPSIAATANPGFNAEDSGVSTPLDGPSFLEYRFVTAVSHHHSHHLPHHIISSNSSAHLWLVLLLIIWAGPQYGKGPTWPGHHVAGGPYFQNGRDFSGLI